MNYTRCSSRLAVTVCMLILPLLVRSGETAGVCAMSLSSNPDTWATRSSMPTARQRLGAAVSSDGRIYAIGGYNGSWPMLTTVEEYDPTTDTWTTRASMPTSRENMGVVAASNGKIYAIGGYDGDALDAVEEYDPTTDTWTTRTNMPTARSGMGVVAASNGKIYTFGGSDGSGFVATAEEYDPATDTWTTRASMPTARFNLGAAEAGNGKIYAVGGWKDWDASYYVGIDTVEEYDPTADTWTTRTNMPTKRHGLGVVAASNGRIYAIGGGDRIIFDTYSLSIEYQAVEEYDPAADTWVGRTDMPTARRGLGVVAAISDKIYAIGGVDRRDYSANVYFDTVEEYTPPASLPSYSLYLPFVSRNAP
jgi:N-acetylneuraminic acid mutarotase